VEEENQQQIVMHIHCTNPKTKITAMQEGPNSVMVEVQLMAIVMKNTINHSKQVPTQLLVGSITQNKHLQ
jgi:hypothetical protein